MLFSPDRVSGFVPSSQEQVQALAERALVGGATGGLGLGVICVHMDGYLDLAFQRGEEHAVAQFLFALEGLAYDSSKVLCAHREGAQALFYVQGLQGPSIRRMAESWCAQANKPRRRGGKRTALSVGASHTSGLQRGALSLEGVRMAAVRAARLAVRSGGGRFAYLEHFWGTSDTVAIQPPVDNAAVAPGEVGARHMDPSEPSTQDIPETRTTPAAAELAREPHLLNEPDRGAADSTPLEANADSDQVGKLEELLHSRESAWQRRVDRLERRLEKLNRILENMEERTHPVGPIDEGLASRFQNVQGLSSTDKLYEAKAGLMSALFLANQQMREESKGRTAG